MLNDAVFKKPISFKKNIKRYPEPEKLAPWYDNQYEFGMCVIIFI